ncbi:hypothetical protein FVEG_00284 [Fusarium verticillioides 7600]|uniref:Uncharacterized protein n=1 Tax=Gibberella moniliformis (strain M3125 / FGSC 7600) TaxID=334819 RepID=W7LC09_GIBM7|nr:hypothetical protein FVEG_00284 [Fusarium verticillioides 7600]EWG36136.1 hypothetical protein FVEG_00284 [Fusarium verticillioides 7600]
MSADTLWIRYVECKEVRILDENTHCCDCGIEWFGFSQPLLGSIFSNKDMDDHIDEQDSDEEQASDQDDSSTEDESEDENESEEENESEDENERSPKHVSLPMRGRLDWVKEAHGSICLLSHHMCSSPDDEMLHVLAEDAKTDRDDPVSKSCTILTGDITSKNLRDVERFAEEFDNYGVYGL